jgi:ELWxxDGT repeat protein
LFLEELEDRSLLSAPFASGTLAIIDGRESFLPPEHLGNACRIIGTIGNYEEFTVALGAPINITGLATADGTIVYEVVNETFGVPSWPGLMAGDARSLLSGTLTSATLPVPFTSAGVGAPETATALPNHLASIALSANFDSAAVSAKSDSSTRSLPFMPISMTNVNGTLFIQGEENGAVELWRSDGTADGTILLNSFAPTFYYEMLNRGEHAVVNGTFFFTADDGHGLELWKSDGTPNGTVMVKDINPGGESGSFSVMANVNGTLFFSAFDGVSNSLWKSDGTADGTVEIARVTVLGPITELNGIALFEGGDASGWTLWKSDGTTAGTSQVVAPSFFQVISYVDFSSLVRRDGSVYFATESAPYHDFLWKSDGTAAGTTMVSELHSGGGFSYAYLGNDGNDANGPLYFPVYSGVGGFFDNYATPPQDLHELWKSDGTAAGTVPIKAFDSWYPDSLTDVNGRLFFTAYEGINGSALWTSDGTADGTVVVKDFGSQMEGSPILLTNVNGTLYFTLSGPGQGFEIWKSDGSSAGTVQVAKLDLSSPFMNPWTQFANANGTLFFTGLDQQGHTELWKTNGTNSGTVLVKIFGDPRPSPTDGSPGPLTNPTDGSPGPSSDPTNTPGGAPVDFVQAVQLLNAGPPAAAGSSTSAPSNCLTIGNFAVNANSIISAASNSEDQANRTAGSLIVAAPRPSSSSSAISTPLEADTIFDLEDPNIVFRV